MSEFETFLLHMINVGRDMGDVPESVFCMLVIMALATTFLTTPLLRRFLPQPDTENPVALLNESASS